MGSCRFCYGDRSLFAQSSSCGHGGLALLRPHRVLLTCNEPVPYGYGDLGAKLMLFDVGVCEARRAALRGESAGASRG